MKIFHIADPHLRDADIEEAIRCCDFIVQTADAECPDLIALAGDIFDSQDVKLDSKAARQGIRFVSALSVIAPVVIVRGTPSHDGNSPEILSLAVGSGRVYVATSPTQIHLSAGAADEKCLFLPDEIDEIPDGEHIAVISLFPAPTKQFFETASDIKTSDAQIAGAMSAIFGGFGAHAAQHQHPGLFHILVGHWNVTGAYISDTQILTGVDIEISKDQMAMANADLICLGHIHKPQQVGKNGFFSGSPWALNWGEDYKHGFYIHSLYDGLLESRFVETPATNLARFKFDTTSGEYDMIFPSDGPPNTIARVDVTVWSDEVELIDKEYINQELSWAKRVDIRINRVPRGNIRSEAILVAERLRDKVLARAKLNKEPVAESVLTKADALETMIPDDLVAAVGKGVCP